MVASAAYEDFLLAFSHWSKAAIRAASAEGFATLRRLDEPFSRFVLHFLAARPHLDPAEFFEGSLHRLLRLNAQPPDGLVLPLLELDDAFWAEFHEAGTRFFQKDGRWVAQHATPAGNAHVRLRAFLGDDADLTPGCVGSAGGAAALPRRQRTAPHQIEILQSGVRESGGRATALQSGASRRTGRTILPRGAEGLPGVVASSRGSERIG